MTLGNNCLWGESLGCTAYATVGVCERDRTSGRNVGLFSPQGAWRLVCVRVCLLVCMWMGRLWVDHMMCGSMCCVLSLGLRLFLVGKWRV